MSDRKYSGSCHCGSVQFSVVGEINELTTCDCSLCVKKNALMTKVHEDHFELLSSADELGEYQWNTKIARHFFCLKCGIYTFHRKRAQPDHYGINIFCLDGFDASKIAVKATQGASMSLDKTETIREIWPGPRQ